MSRKPENEPSRPRTIVHDGGAPTLLPDAGFRLSREVIERYQETRDQRVGSLLVIAGLAADIGNATLVEAQATIGRENCDMRLADGRVSRLHAVVERRGNGYWVRDNRSTNGTLLGGRPVLEEAALTDGDKLIIGETVIKFTLVDPTEADYLRMMDRLVGRDDLTGLLSKHRFDAAFEQAVAQALRLDRPLAALMMDMDHLKALNDACGHHVGAAAIKRVGEFIDRLLKGKGQACRFGGDEFSAFLPGAGLSQAREMGERIRLVVEAADLAPAESGVRVTLSIGAATLQPGQTRARDLLDLADQALYRAKAAGRNQVSA